MPHRSLRTIAFVIGAFLIVAASRIAAQPTNASNSTARPTVPSKAELEVALTQMLSGATLEGSFTSTGAGSDPNKFSTEKYTLGQVKKIGGNLWLIPARIQYGEHDVTLPLTLPIRWAGDTPVIVVDNVGLPGFGTVSARVMFFADHYAGYWKHGNSGGHLFGTIRHGEKPSGDNSRPVENKPPPSRVKSLGGKQENK
jgi:hypothetical protein